MERDIASTPDRAPDAAVRRTPRVRLPRALRTTSFRLSLLFLALFAAAAAAFLAYIYVATAGEVMRRADAEVDRELGSLETVYARGGVSALSGVLTERAQGARAYRYLLMRPDGTPLAGNLVGTPVAPRDAPGQATFRVQQTDTEGAVVRHEAWGRQSRLSGGELLFVAADIGEGRAFLMRIVHALWGAGVLVILLGLGGGALISRDIARRTSGLIAAIAAVEAGALDRRAPTRGVGDEFDELALGLNAMLDRVERLMSDVRHAGDAIAHDLRSPLTRLRARLEAALVQAQAGRADPLSALGAAVDDTDAVLRTFGAVLAISRLQSAGLRDGGAVFDLTPLARELAELYTPTCEDNGLSFTTELTPHVDVRGDRDFVAQAVSNLLDNAVKYTPRGGAVTLRTRRRASGEREVSVTDTGPGVPAADRPRVLERFVRLEASRTAPGAGLGLSLVAAVAQAHGGRLDLDDGPGASGADDDTRTGPGLRAALTFPAA